MCSWNIRNYITEALPGIYSTNYSQLKRSTRATYMIHATDTRDTWKRHA